MVTVPEAARHLGVSERRVRQLIDANVLAAEQSGGRWVVDPRSLNRKPLASRPLSSHNAEALLNILDGLAPGIDPSAASRLRRKLRSLPMDNEGADVLRSWLSNRAERFNLRLDQRCLDRLRSDPRLKPSGVSHFDSFMSSHGMVEAYVSDADFDEIARDYEFLVDDLDPNVVLRISDRQRVSRSMVMADLLDSSDPRAYHQGVVLMGELLLG